MRILQVKFKYNNKKYNLKAKFNDDLTLPLIKANLNACDEDFENDYWCVSWVIEENTEDFSQSLSAEVQFNYDDYQRNTSYNYPVVRIWQEVIIDEVNAQIIWK